MPKLPTVDRFRLSCEVAVSDLGPIIAQLTKMGLTNINFELMTDVLAFAEKVKHDVRSPDHLKAWTEDHPTFKAIDAVNHFRNTGRGNGSAAYPALAELVEAGVLKKLGSGNYARADVKHIAAPKKEAKPKGDTQNRYTVPHTGLIMRLIKRKHGHITTEQIKDGFEKDGRPRASASPAIKDCLDKKLIKRVADGEYEMIETPAPKNGNGATQVAEATNG